MICRRLGTASEDAALPPADLGGARMADFGASVLQPRIQSTPDHAGTIISLDKNDAITLDGVATSGLHANIISFA